MASRLRREGRARGKAAPQRVRASRLRIAAKAAICVLLAAVLVVPAVFVNTAIGYVAAIAYLIVLLLSFAYVRILKRRLAFSAGGAIGEVERGSTASFSLTVSNRSFLPATRIRVMFFMSDLFGGEGAVDAHYLTLGPRRDKTFDFNVRFDHIGTYQVGIREVTVLDLIGVFSHTRVNDELTEVSVQPRLFDVGSLPLSKDAAVEAKKNFTTVINDGMDYSGVREYRWGDPIKAIHWKLSARMVEGEYYTRLYETNANPGLAIIADFDAPDYTVEELMGIYDAVVECAFSLERYADRNGFDAELVFRDKGKRQRRYFTPLAGRHREILRRMPQIFSPGTGRDALGLIRTELESAFAASNMIVCSSVISEELAQSLVAARVGKRAPLLFAIVPQTASDERRKEIMKLLRQMESAGVTYRIISSAQVLEGGRS